MQCYNILRNILIQGHNMTNTSTCSDLHEETQNKHGFMHPLSELSLSFIQYAATIEAPVLDLGCSYGIASIKAIKAGAKNVIACDMEQKHLDILQKRALDLNISTANLTLKLGKFPDEVDFENNSIGAILTSYMLSFLTLDELEKGLVKIFNWLKPNGKLFVGLYTIYIKKFSNEIFKEEYRKRITQGQKWPGYFEDFKQFSLSEIESNNALPSKIHYFEKDSLTKALTDVGFIIESANYLDGKSNGAVADSINDGREILSIIAKKP